MTDPDKKEPTKEPGSPPPAITIKLGDEEKTLTADDVTELVARQSGLQNKINELSTFQKVLDRYNVDPDTYLKHSEGAIAIASKLIEDGIIDPQGNILKKEPAAPAPRREDSSFFHKSGEGESKVEEVTQKALGPLYDKLQKIEETQGRLIEMDMRNRLSRQFPDLNEGDLDNVFDVAFRDRKLSLSQHAQAYLEHKQKSMGELRKQHAQEFGINLEEWEKQKLEEKTKKDKGVDDLSWMVKDKKLSFATQDDKSVSPKKAMLEYFKKLGR
jgi:hypothetical protein